jgi:peptidoglycan/LPS O-acetylase OafA/YrhL
LAQIEGQLVTPSLRLKQDSYSRIPELDGIRAIAIGMVMIMHALFAFPFPTTINRLFYLAIKVSIRTSSTR